MHLLALTLCHVANHRLGRLCECNNLFSSYERCTLSNAFAVSVQSDFRLCVQALGVPNQNIYSNTLMYNADGEFSGHDETEPTSRAGGKAKVVVDLRAEHGYKTVVMIGDGATDMGARDTENMDGLRGADAFIGYGGVRVREKVHTIR